MRPNPIPTGPALERLLESVEMDMNLDFYRVLPAALGRDAGVDATQVGQALRLTARAFDHPMFNRVMGIDLTAPSGAPPDDSATILDRESAHYAAAGIRRWMIQVLPQFESSAFQASASARGLVRHRGWAKHLGPADADIPTPRTDLRVVRLGDTATQDLHLVGQWARIVAEGFGIPPALVPWLEGLAGQDAWHLFVALDGDEPVATGALYVSETESGSFAHLNFGATLPDFRRRGAQSALIAHRIAAARELGVEWIVSETDEELPDRPNPSYHNLVRLGLPVAYVRANWGPPKPVE